MNPSRTKPNAPRRPLSDAQLQARRDNSKKSTGPKTEEGKARSRANALTHGLTATVCLKPEDQHAVALRLAGLEADLRPNGATERLLVLQVACASVRLERLMLEEDALRAHRRRHAIERWDMTRESEVQTLIDRLYGVADGVAPFCVGRAPEPVALATLVKDLERTAFGCARLADDWDALAERLEAEGNWTDTQADRALRLLGHAGVVTPDARRDVRGAQFAVLALCLDEVAGSAGVPPASGAGGPEARAPRGSGPEARLLAEIDTAFGDSTEHLDHAKRLELARINLPTPDEASDRLRDLARDEAKRLTERMEELWQHIDGPDRAEAPDRATAATDPADQLLYRYRTSAARALNQALALLVRSRSTGLLGLGIEAPEQATAILSAALRGVGDSAPATPDMSDGASVAGDGDGFRAMAAAFVAGAPAWARNEAKPSTPVHQGNSPGGADIPVCPGATGQTGMSAPPEVSGAQETIRPGFPGQTGMSAPPEASVSDPAEASISGPSSTSGERQAQEAAPQTSPAVPMNPRPTPAQNEAKPPRFDFPTGPFNGRSEVETVPISIVPRR